ncbi:hypothetical protein CRX72_04050 [Pantoea sp. BRM17]|nr:hypothetical protein CRX72_04050 [Pantoea sp. BRM17]
MAGDHLWCKRAGTRRGGIPVSYDDDRGRHYSPFLLTLALIFLGFSGLGISVWPNIIPPSVTIWEAASPPQSQAFMLVGSLLIIPMILGYTFWSYKMSALATPLVIALLVIVGIISLWTPFAHEAISQRWFTRPNLFWFLPVPVLVLLCSWGIMRAIKREALLATFSQGVAVGAMINGFPVKGREFAGSALDWLAPFPLFCGVGLVVAYALLGCTWLIMKTENELHRETWLVLGGAGLYGAFPLAYAVIADALAIPLTAMLIGLIFRGVAFEFRFKATEEHRAFWDKSFIAGSSLDASQEGK